MKGSLLELSLDGRMEVSESGVSVSVYHARVHVLLVVVGEPFGLVQQTVFQHVLGAQDDRKPFVVVDVLEFGDQYPPGFLVQDLVVPVRVNVRQHGGDAVVLSEEQDLQNGQLRVLIGSSVACGQRQNNNDERTSGTRT